MEKRYLGILFLMLGFSIPLVSAFVYESAQQTVTQTIQEIATITLQNSALGNLEEGETKTYTKVGGGGDVELATLGDAISITTGKASAYLHLDSDLNDLTDYSVYSIVVKFSAVVGSTYSVGDTACTLTLASPDYSSVDLDAAGTWKFDFEITTTASPVDADTPTTVTIVVTAESTT
ncbi:MAG: hypothetical protein NWF13_07940 [Candidatus Bathyarchaeota archaeon]|nr:hypothetical protein [Candidatus Bathyarchaeota archaeon]